MKYLIRDQVINSDHIVRAIYWEEQGVMDSRCEITLTSLIVHEFDKVANSECVVLRGKQADRFWDAYSGDAYTIVSPKAEAQP